MPIDRESFHRVLAIELGTSIEYSADTVEEGSATTVWLSCTQDGIELLVEDGVTRKSMRRVIDLSQVEAGARSRLLALTVAEFVVASWVELRLPEPPPIPPAGPPPTARTQRVVAQLVAERLPPPPIVPSTPTEWQLGASFATSFFSSGSKPVPGGEVRLTQRPSPELAFAVGVQVGRSSERALFLKQDVGSVQFTTTSALVSALYSIHLGDFALSVGVGGRVGLVHMAGHSENRGLIAKKFYAPWGGPLVLVGLAYPITTHLRAVLDLEAGLVTQPAQASIGETVVMQLNGAWGGLALGLAWVF